MKHKIYKLLFLLAFLFCAVQIKAEITPEATQKRAFVAPETQFNNPQTPAEMRRRLGFAALIFLLVWLGATIALKNAVWEDVDLTSENNANKT